MQRKNTEIPSPLKRVYIYIMPKLKTQKNEYKMVSNIKCYTYLANLNIALRKKKKIKNLTLIQNIAQKKRQTKEAGNRW